MMTGCHRIRSRRPGGLRGVPAFLSTALLKVSTLLGVTALLGVTILLSGCTVPAAAPPAGGLGIGWRVERSLELEYAKNFSVDYYPEDYALVTLSDKSRFLVVPPGRTAPEGIGGDITVLQRPLRSVYLVATSVMAQFDELHALDQIRLSGTRAADWQSQNARTAMENGSIVFAGKYSAPDYELILSSQCDLAIESSMINHVPEVKEKLLGMKVPVLIDQSSYEKHPLGRTEWIKLYGVLTGREEQAAASFDRQAALLREASVQSGTGKSVAFFYISSAGQVVVRKPGDYITKMIDLAGGSYAFSHLGDPEQAGNTVNLDMEAFYAAARDADVLIYNSALAGEVASLADLTARNALLSKFKAVQTGNVWCTEKNLYQETTRLGLMVSDLNRLLTDPDPTLNQLHFFTRLR